MKTRSNLTRDLRLALLQIACLLMALPSVFAQGLTIANPQWNITLTDFGYSDFLLDNTPGFEGREYLSGEWGAAVGYEVSGGPNTSRRSYTHSAATSKDVRQSMFYCTTLHIHSQKTASEC